MSSNRIIHGDSRLVAADHLLPGTVDCIVADPPYGVDYQSRMAETPRGLEIVEDVEGDKDLAGALLSFHGVMDALKPAMADECDIYVFTRWDIVDHWMKAVRSLGHGIKYKMLLIWNKGDPGMGDIDANWGCGHELILYCKRGRRDVAYRRSGIITVDKVRPRDMIHPTEKPVPLIEELVRMSTKRGDLVVDPYSGSGSTAVACQRNGRNSLSFELALKYIAPSRQRLKGLVMDL